MINKTGSPFIAPLVMLVMSAGVTAAEYYPIVKTNATFELDGKLDEPEWKHATKVELPYNINPGLSTPAPVKTTAYIYETESSLMVGFIADDPDPSKIRAYYRDRDTIFQDDFVGIVIDTFNDNRRAYEFFVNPFGVQGDLIKDDTQGGNEDHNWDAIWNSAGHISNTGYSVEIEIPFNVMRFPADKESMDWGIQVLRIYPRDKRMVLANTVIDRNLDCSLCQFDKLTGLSKKEQGNNLQITPTLTYSYSEGKSVIPGEWDESDDKADAGVNVRWGINDNVYLNATINPDFSQVEADAAQLDINNTFSLFVNEKRPFFLDGRDYFSTQRMNLLHTRNINAPEYGLKLTGKQDAHTYGLLAANDESTAFLMPGNQGSSVAELDEKSEVLVGRYRMDIGSRSNVGAIITNRQGSDYKNTVTSIDGRNSLTKSDTISYQVSYSDTTNPDSIQEDFDVARKQSDSAYSLRYSHNAHNYGFSANHMNFGEDFRADLGFVGQTGVRKSIVGGYYSWLQEDGSSWSRYGVNGDWDITHDEDGNVLEREIEMYVNADGPRQLFLEGGVVSRTSFWEGQFYDVVNPMTFFRFDPIDNLRVWTFLRGGDQIDYANNRLGDGKIAEIGGAFKITKHLNGELNYNHRKLDVEGGNLFTANQYDLRLNYQFNLKSFIRFNVQYTQIDRNQDLYVDKDVTEKFEGMRTELLYAYKLNPQSLFYLGYTDRGKKDDLVDEIEKDHRKVFMKLSYAFRM